MKKTHSSLVESPPQLTIVGKREKSRSGKKYGSVAMLYIEEYKVQVTTYRKGNKKLSYF